MALLTVLFSIGVFVFLLYAFAKWRQQYWKRIGVPQLTPNIIFGDGFLLHTGKTSIKEFYEDLYFNTKARGQKFVGIYHALMPEIVIADATLSKRILNQDFEYFQSHGMFYHKSNILTMNIFSLEGEEWRGRRTKLTPMFTSGKMKMIFSIITNKSEKLLEAINKCGTNDAINAEDLFKRYTTEIIASTAFGLDIDVLNEPNHKFREIGEETLKPHLLNFALERIFSRNFLGSIGYQAIASHIVEYFSKVVKDTLSHREANGIERKDFLQLMLQLKHHGKINENDRVDENQKIKHLLTDNDIVAESFFMYLAGYETSATTMVFALHELALNQEIQNKLRNEITEVIEKHGEITYEAVMDMEYLDKVVKETLRKYPIVPVLPRTCTKDYKIPNTNVVIKKGTAVQIPCIGLHSDPEFYPNPKIFDPERFSVENKMRRPDAPWIPFGDGPRQCLGMRLGLLQTKVGIITFIKNFHIFLDKSMTVPLQPQKSIFLYHPVEELLLRIEKV